MASEKVLMSIPHARATGTKHTGGAMAFDMAGNLLLTIGNNSMDEPHAADEEDGKYSAEGSPSNAGDLRGSVLRIRPDESARGYGVPAGNFGEYWSQEFARQGKADLAQEYADPAKVKPEIYVKGTRSPYSLTVDPYRGWMTW